MTTCSFLTKYGITCGYDQFKDTRISEITRNKWKERRNKTASLDADDTKKAAETGKQIKAKKEQAEKERAAATASGLQNVGPNGKDAKSTSAANESIQKNLDSQTQAGSGRAAGTLGCFESNSYGGTSFVDATTACNDCNDDVKGYFRSAVSQMLSIHDVR